MTLKETGQAIGGFFVHCSTYMMTEHLSDIMNSVHDILVVID